MRRLLCILMVFALCLCGCGGGGNEAQSTGSGGEPKSTSINQMKDWMSGQTGAPPTDTAEQGDNELAIAEGWWYRPEGYEPEGISVVDIFYIDSQAGTWTVYNELGEMGDTMMAGMDGGLLCLEFPLGDIYYEIDGDALINEEGEVDFVRGEPMDEPDRTAFTGRWYASGDIDGNYFLFEGNAFSEYLTPYDGGEDILLDEGTFRLGTIELHVGDEVREDVLKLELEGHSFMTDDLYIMDNGVALLEDSFDDIYYIREDAIGTEAAQLATMQCELMIRDWEMETEDGKVNISFRHPDVFHIYSYPPGGGEATYIASGSWSMDGNTITLYANDGSEQSAVMSEDMEALELDSGEVFEDTGW